WVQLVVSPESNKWRDRAMAYISAVKSGRSPEIGKAITKSLFSLGGEVIGSLMRGGGYEVKKEGAKVELSPGTDLMLKAVEEKSSKLGFKTKIRLVVWDKDEMSAKAKLQLALGTFKQFDSTNLNSFKPGKYVSDRAAILSNYGGRELGKDAVILNVTELASIYHLPNVSVATPNIVWAGSRKGEPPANLPLVGEVPAVELTTLASTNFRGAQEKFGIKLKDRHRHIYIIGKSGTGKSTLLANMAIDDVRERRGVGIIDPHGDYVDTVLKYVPNYRVNDVILFDPGDRDYPIAVNMLELRDPKYKVVVASGVVGIFKKIFGYSWGPRLEYWLSSAVMALLDYPDSTLMMIPQLFTDLSFREKVIAKISDPLIKARWVNEYGKLDQKQQSETISPILNKVGQFLSSPVIRNIVGQPKSSIDFREVMDEGKILLVKLAKGIIGEDNAALLGAMIITQLQLAAMSRADTEEKARKDFYLYVDEFQNFATESFQVILSESRKYHLSLTLANQYMEQLIPEVSDAIFGNVNTIITFRVGGDDAKKLEKEFAPVFEANDLVNLNMFNIYIKLSIDNITTNAFSAQTLPLPDDINNNEEKILTVSREHYSRAASFVEERISKALEVQQSFAPQPRPAQRWEKPAGQSTQSKPSFGTPQKQGQYQAPAAPRPQSGGAQNPQSQRSPFGAAPAQSHRPLPNRPVPFRPAMKVEQPPKSSQQSAPVKRKPDDSLLKKVISAMEAKKPWVPGQKPAQSKPNPVADLGADKKTIEDIRR
ncbi:MAG: type IV secretion system DNA-binding domain-containing protein, partial [Patescibacteria group bacterium]